MWGSVPFKNFVIPFLRLQASLGGDVLSNIFYLFDYKMDKLSTDEEVARTTLVTLDQVTEKYNKTTKFGTSMIVLFHDTKI